MKTSWIKEFFRPTIAKIVVTILFALVALFSLGVLIVCGDTYPNHDPLTCSINVIILLFLSIGGLLLEIIDYPLSYFLALIWIYFLSCVLFFSLVYSLI